MSEAAVLNEHALSTYWESQNPRVDIRMQDSVGNVTVFWDENQKCAHAISSARFFRIGEQDWISRAPMEKLVSHFESRNSR